jgi:6-phosphogluconolactonase (cycloisomerase 2 family)
VTYTPKFAYAANSDDNDISTYAMNVENGSLASVPGSPFSVDGPAASDPQAVSVAIDPMGKFEYVVEYNGNGPNGYIAAYKLNFLTGALSFTSASPFAIGDQPRWVTLDPSGRFLYATNSFSDDISGFGINRASGNLVALSASPYSTGPATNPWSVAIDPSGQFLVVSKEGANQVECFSIDSVSGNLTAVSSAPTGSNPQGLTIDPSGRFVYVSAVEGIYGYTLSPSGSLAAIPGSPFIAGGDPVAVAVDPIGRFLYSANQGSNDVSAFAINQSTGALVPVFGSPFLAGQNPHMLIVDDSAGFLYVTNDGDNNISAYAIDAVTGALTPNPSGPFTAGSVTYAIAALASAH